MIALMFVYYYVKDVKIIFPPYYRWYNKTAEVFSKLLKQTNNTVRYL